jgi:hypothetical protein
MLLNPKNGSLIKSKTNLYTVTFNQKNKHYEQSSIHNRGNFNHPLGNRLLCL